MKNIKEKEVEKEFYFCEIKSKIDQAYKDNIICSRNFIIEDKSDEVLKYHIKDHLKYGYKVVYITSRNSQNLNDLNPKIMNKEHLYSTHFIQPGESYNEAYYNLYGLELDLSTLKTSTILEEVIDFKNLAHKYYYANSNHKIYSIPFHEFFNNKFTIIEECNDEAALLALLQFKKEKRDHGHQLLILDNIFSEIKDYQVLMHLIKRSRMFDYSICLINLTENLQTMRPIFPNFETIIKDGKYKFN